MADAAVPAAALEADIAALAQKGAGKTYAMKGLVERLLDAGERVVVLDPLSSWWALKVLADGSPGYPVAVVGGPRADIPLDPARGEALGQFIAGGDLSVVVDVGELRRGAQLIPFATDLLEALYRHNREPLTVVLEEADVFAPQSPAQDGTRRMLDAADQIARRGRARGLRLWTITQRPARLHKDVLTQASTLLLLRLRAPQDRAAAQAWIEGNADKARAAEIVAELASLPVGEGWVWSPDHDVLGRVRFPSIRTLDTSATPRAGERRPEAVALASVDVAALHQALAATPAADATAAPSAVPDKEAIEAARLDGFKWGENVGRASAFGHVLHRLRQLVAEVAALEQTEEGPPPPAGDAKPADPPPSQSPPTSPPSPPASMKRRSPPPPSQPSPGTIEALPAAARELIEMARQAPRQVTWAEAAILAGRLPHGGHYERARKAAAEVFGEPPRPSSSSEHLDVADIVWRLSEKFKGKGAAPRAFRHIFSAGPRSREEIAADFDAKPSGGHFERTIHALRHSPLVVTLPDGRFDVAPILRALPRPA